MMDPAERHELRTANNGLRAHVDHLLDALAEQRTKLAEAKDHVDALRAQGRSSDGSVLVVVDGAGIVTDVQLTKEAMRTTPERLGAAMVEAARAAAAEAHRQQREILAPHYDTLPDLPDLIPGAPSLRLPDQRT